MGILDTERDTDTETESRDQETQLSKAEGVYNYDQAADKRVDDKVGSKYAKQSQYKRGSAPRRPTKGRPQKRRPSRRPAKRPSKSYGRSRSYRKPQQSYQRTRQIS